MQNNYNADRPRAREGNDKRDFESNTLFVMKPVDANRFAFKKWLGEREFNTYKAGWKDRKGQDGIGLSFESRSGKLRKVGVVICMDDCLEETISIIEDHLGFGEGEHNA